uniref:Uncharacterized protein n=1 Tax=Rhizophora mucronata TaxID=61149 RepID=A0A2P2P760_RHIMU
MYEIPMSLEFTTLPSIPFVRLDYSFSAYLYLEYLEFRFQLIDVFPTYRTSSPLCVQTSKAKQSPELNTRFAQTLLIS